MTGHGPAMIGHAFRQNPSGKNFMTGHALHDRSCFVNEKSSGLNFMTGHGPAMTGHASRQKLSGLIFITGHASRQNSRNFQKT